MMTDSRSSSRRGEQDSKIASSAAARRSWTGVRSMPGKAFPCKPNKRQTAQLPRRLSSVELMPRHVEAPDGRFPRRREVSEPGFSARGRAGLFCAGPGPGGGKFLWLHWLQSYSCSSHGYDCFSLWKRWLCGLALNRGGMRRMRSARFPTHGEYIAEPNQNPQPLRARPCSILEAWATVPLWRFFASKSTTPTQCRPRSKASPSSLLPREVRAEIVR